MPQVRQGMENCRPEKGWTNAVVQINTTLVWYAKRFTAVLSGHLSTELEKWILPTKQS